MYIRTLKTHHVRTVAHVREFGGLWKREKTQQALYNYLRMGSATLFQLAFLWAKATRISHGEKFPFPKVYKIQHAKNNIIIIIIIIIMQAYI